jgi:hypothetical protein
LQRGLLVCDRVASARSRARSTNKANLGRPGWCPQGNSAEQSRFRQSAGAAEGEICKTKPNWGALGYLGAGARGAYHAKRSQSGRPATAPAGEMRQTNPIWWGPIAPNKPNLAGRPRPWRSKYAKRSQSARRGWAALARPRPADWAKQSQTWAGWGIWVDAKGAYCAKRSQSGAARLPSGGQLRKTNPIWPSRWAGRSPGGRNAPNEANLGRLHPATCWNGVKRSQFPGNPQLSLDFVLGNLYFRVFPERGEGTALLRLQIRDGPSAVSQPLVCDSPCAIPDTGCDSDRKTVRNSGKRRMSE